MRPGTLGGHRLGDPSYDLCRKARFTRHPRPSSIEIWFALVMQARQSISRLASERVGPWTIETAVSLRTDEPGRDGHLAQGWESSG